MEWGTESKRSFNCSAVEVQFWFYFCFFFFFLFFGAGDRTQGLALPMQALYH